SFLYDVIFMDVRMPEMDGLAATAMIRKRGGHLARIPIIALTANAFAEDVKACFEAGMNQFVPKPVNKTMLLAAILKAMGGGSIPRHAADQGLPDERPEAALDPVALDDMAESIGLDGLAEMTSMFEQ